MKMQKLIGIAKDMGIPFKVGTSKEELIRAIQRKEGYSDCFRRKDSCPEERCLWMEDCLPAKKLSSLTK